MKSSSFSKAGQTLHASCANVSALKADPAAAVEGLTQLQVSMTAQEVKVAYTRNYITKFRDFVYNENLFELFAKRYQLARVDESREGAVIQAVDAAQPAERKSKPKKALIAVLTTPTTAFALLLFLFVRQAVRNSSCDADAAERLSNLRRSRTRALGRTSSIHS